MRIKPMFNLKEFTGVDRARLILIAVGVTVDSLVQVVIMILTVETIPSYGIPVLGLFMAAALKLQPIIKSRVCVNTLVKIWILVEFLWLVSLLLYGYLPVVTFVGSILTDIVACTFLPVLYAWYAEDLAKRDPDTVADYSVTRNVILADAVLVGSLIAISVLAVGSAHHLMIIGSMLQVGTVGVLLYYYKYLKVIDYGENNYENK